MSLERAIVKSNTSGSMTRLELVTAVVYAMEKLAEILNRFVGEPMNEYNLTIIRHECANVIINLRAMGLIGPNPVTPIIETTIVGKGIICVDWE